MQYRLATPIITGSQATCHENEQLLGETILRSYHVYRAAAVWDPASWASRKPERSNTYVVLSVSQLLPALSTICFTPLLAAAMLDEGTTVEREQ